jgi:hypothetical protein
MHGLIESMRGPFAEALAPFKGGTNARAEILRSANNHASTNEWAHIHYEPTRSEDGGIHSYSESGLPSYTVYMDRLPTPLRTHDRLRIREITLEIEYGAFPANIGPIDQYQAVLRGESAL